MALLPGIGGYALLAITSFLFLYELWAAIRYPFERHESLYRACALVWGFGVASKATGFGPDFARNWLEDFGFPIAMGWALWRLTYGHAFKRDYKLANGLAGRNLLVRETIPDRMHMLWFGLALSYVYEFVVGTFMSDYRSAHPGEPTFVGGFDWWDIAVYTLSFAVGLAILWSWRRRLACMYDEHLKIDKARAEAERRGKRKPKK